MKDQILKLLHAAPFNAFVIDVAEDLAYSIPTLDHIVVGEKLIGIAGDDGLIDLIPYSKIRRIRTLAEAA